MRRQGVEWHNQQQHPESPPTWRIKLSHLLRPSLQRVCAAETITGCQKHRADPAKPNDQKNDHKKMTKRKRALNREPSKSLCLKEARAGIEPANSGFAVR